MKSIKELRISQGLSQAAFGKVIGVSTATIGAYENGKMEPSDKVLDKIKEVYGVVFERQTKKKAAKKPAQIIVQSPLGGEITPEEIAARIGAADKIYIRVDKNKAYWVRGEETGSIDLW